MRQSLWWVAAVLVVAAVVVGRLFFLDVMRVTSGSMEPTVCGGDVVLTGRLAPDVPLAGGDIVVFTNPEDGSDSLKRVVALPGQVVTMEDGQLVVDGVAVDEPYVDLSTIDGVYFGPKTVPPGGVFLMGDNRELSIDSRQYGAVDRMAVHDRMLTRIPVGSCADRR